MTLEKQRWNIEQCNRCHQCKANPRLTSKQFAPLCPSIEYGQFHSYSASGKIITAYALMNGRADYTEEVMDSITACTLCGACDTACQFILGDLVQPLDGIYELRAKMFAEGKVPAAQRKLLDNIASHGNPDGRPASERTDWAKGLNLVDATSAKVDVLLHIGSANAFDKRQWPGLIGIAAALTATGVVVGTLGDKEPDAGALAFELGHRDLAKACADETVRLVRASGAALLVTCDASAIAAFRNFYVRMGVTLDPVRVLHVTEYLGELAAEGKWRASAPASEEEVVTYHDPCRLGRLSEPYEPWEGEWTTVMNGMRIAAPPRPHRFGLGGVYDAPRELLKAVPGTRLVEMERTREFAYCCGAGGGGKEAHPDFAEKAALHRLEEAAATGATTLVSSCGTCTRHLGAIAEKHGLGIRVTDLAGYVTKAQA